ncbi:MULTISPECIES: ScyD/ScyE family protein [Spirosoma]|nr:MULTISPECIES: ScyD/ScyE family protein [Spirosoma]
MRTSLLAALSVCTLLLLNSCQDHLVPSGPSRLRVDDVATQLAFPIGMSADNQGRIWVAETAAGMVSVIMPGGQKYPVITGFSVSISPENTPDGLNHLLYKDGMLYILHGIDEKMYIANVGSFKPGDAPVSFNTLKSEAIGQFVLDYKFTDDTEDSNLYNLTFGPDGDLFIADAGANAIIRRAKNGALSVFATLPGLPNPTQVGPPVIQAVPTGITFDGKRFLVSTLSGFPFPVGKARVFQIDVAGNVSLYQDGFTSLVDVLFAPDQNPLILEIAQFGPQGLTPKTGKLIRSVNGQATTLLEGLNLPTDIELGNAANTYYINSLADGKIQKITY